MRLPCIDGDGLNGGDTHLFKDFKTIRLFYSLDQKSLSHLLLLLHEISHLFLTIDQYSDNSIMSYNFLSDFDLLVYEDEVDIFCLFEDFLDQFEFDQLSKDLIDSSTRAMAREGRLLNLKQLDLHTQDHIIDLYVNNIDAALYPSYLYYRIATSHRLREQYKVALSYYEESIEVYHSPREVNTSKGVIPMYHPTFSLKEVKQEKTKCLILMKRYNDAINFLLAQRGDEWDEDHIKYYYLAVAYMGLGLDNRSEEYFQRAERLKPEEEGWPMRVFQEDREMFIEVVEDESDG